MSDMQAPVVSGNQTRRGYMKDYVPPPVSERIGSQAVRRWAVLALYLGYPAFIGAMWLGSVFNRQHQRLAALPFLAVLLLAVAAMLWGGYVLLARTAINLPNISDRVLDERQRLVRDAAYRVSFRIVSGVLLVAALYMMLALGFGWPLPHSAEAAQAVFWATFIVTATLPTAIIAWTTPAPPTYDDEVS